MNDITADFRCACGKLLLRGMILSGAIEVKCRSCKRIETIEAFSGGPLDTERYVLVLNTDGMVLRFSGSAPAILGYSRDELLKKRIADVIVMLAPDFYPALSQALGTTGPTILLFQSFQRHRDQSMAPVEVEAQYLSGTTGAIIFSVKKRRPLHLTDSLPVRA